MLHKLIGIISYVLVMLPEIVHILLLNQTLVVAHLLHLRWDVSHTSLHCLI